MLELKIRSMPGSIALCAAGIAASTGLSLFINIPQINISLLFLIIGSLFCYLIINLFVYPKAKTVQLLQLTIISLILFLTNFISSYFILSFISHSLITINSRFAVTANPFYYAASILSGVLASIALIKLDRTKKTETATINTTENVAAPNTVQSEITESKEVIPKEAEHFEPVKITPPEPLKTENNTEVFYTQNISEDFSNKNNIKEEENNTALEQHDEIFANNIDSLPDISIEETNNVQPEKSTGIYDASIFEFDSDKIPDNVRLAENKDHKKTGEGGTISSIGKLLINHRDIENIIETNELMQQIGCTNEDIDVVSMATGVKIYEKFNKVMVEYTQVKDLTLSNKAGFTIASIINDNRRSETVGAIASSAFLVLKNYLARLEIYDLQKVFFETETSIHSIFLVNDFILFFVTEKDFDPVNYSLVKDVLDQATISNQDLSVIKNIKGVLESAITNNEGILVGSINSNNPKILASLSSAIFENLKVFIKNIQPVSLQKITIFAGNKVLTIRKYNDKIAGLITSSDGPVKLSDNILEIEEFIK